MRKFAPVIKIKELVFFLLCFIAAMGLLMPEGIGHIAPSLIQVYRVLQILALGIACVGAIFVYFKLNLVCWLIIIYYAALYGITFLIRRTLPSVWEPIIVVSLSVILSVGYRKSPNPTLSAFRITFEILTYAQFLTQLAYPNGMFVNEGYAQNWLLGFKNLPIRILLPGLCIALIDCYRRKGRILTIRMILHALVFTNIIILSDSATSLVGMGCFYILLIVFYKRQFPKWLNIVTVMLATILIFVLIYFANIQYRFEFLLVGLLGKSLDFTGRTTVWRHAMQSFFQNPFLGIGLYDSYKTILGAYNHAHQYWLQIALQSGIVGLILHSSIFVSANSSLKRTGAKFESRIIAITCFCLLIMGIDEKLATAYMFLPILALLGEMGRQQKRQASIHPQSVKI